MNRLFYYDGNYVILSGGSLVVTTAAEVENYCRITRNVVLVAFLAPDDVRATNDLFWSHTDMVKEIVRLDETFFSTMTAMLFQDRLISAASYALLRTWLLGLNSDLITYLAQTDGI